MKELLDQSFKKYNQPNFIQDDPICIPHSFSKKQDIEIMGFWAAVLAWGQRKTIINKCRELVELMDHAPYDFIMNHEESDLEKFLSFKHRTFNDIDTLYFLSFFKRHYSNYESLEDAFLLGYTPSDENVENALIQFHNYFFDDEDAPQRTRKHIATPQRNSACKRINMFLRWMVRKDDKGVDFGIWDTIQPSQLICPLDVHVERVSRKLKLLERKQSDWKSAVELTKHLKQFDAQDPVKYDFALFGLGLEKFASS
ncbi:TIGR02757 family protein [Flammeovirga agarivorans]|uniref:TIGR02757 family protein n=1 Tax=Flammeovirga agarivorans TaxID=2726742 RepID=A0A7X8XTZ6_9BACT|nr:TIGR02757 family protein [Flammeovirga agarivorans]NLR89615.1 TIGR02757 family protein [Flammeovirga agarivorans]